jgi:methanogenic corrinoid protein MtbC1
MALLPLRVLVDVIPRPLHEVGTRWELGEISVAVEHMATAAAQNVLHKVVGLLPAAESNGKTVVVAAIEGELHELGPRIVADVLEAAGWEVFYVGAATPTDAVIWLVRERQPDAVVLSATLPSKLGTLTDAVRRIRSECPSRPFILVGGQACAGRTDVAAKVGADAVELRADMAARAAATSVHRSRPWRRRRITDATRGAGSRPPWRRAQQSRNRTEIDDLRSNNRDSRAAHPAQARAA